LKIKEQTGSQFDGDLILESIVVSATTTDSVASIAVESPLECAVGSFKRTAKIFGGFAQDVAAADFRILVLVPAIHGPFAERLALGSAKPSSVTSLTACTTTSIAILIVRWIGTARSQQVATISNFVSVVVQPADSF
jgi:hypothetical protein